MAEIIPATCVSCQDSSLSTTASIVGILTFVYALLAGLWFYLKSGANAIATSPEQFSTILTSITKHLHEISTFEIDEAGSGPEHEDLLLKTKRFRYQGLVILQQLARWLGSGQEFEKYDALIERGRIGPRVGLEASEFEGAFLLFQRILSGIFKMARYTSVFGCSYSMLLSPHSIRWALWFRWNQGPLRRALDEYHEMAQEIEKIRQRQAARSQQDALRRICEKLEGLERQQERLSAAIGVPRTENWETQEKDPPASLMRPRPPRVSHSMLSLARDTPLPDEESFP